MKSLVILAFALASSTSLLAEAPPSRDYFPVKFEAEIPSWQDFSKVRFFVAQGEANRFYLAIAVDGRNYYDVTLTLTSNQKPIITQRLVATSITHWHMAVIELEGNSKIDDLSDVHITEFTANTK